MSLEDYEELLFLEPRRLYDPAIVGVGDRMGHNFLIYDRVKVIAAIQEWLECDEEEAEDWFSYNTNGGWYGEATWAFIEYPEEEP